MRAVPAGHPGRSMTSSRGRQRSQTGRSVQFTNEGFHTATLLPRPGPRPPITMSMASSSADIDDTALNPNGTTKVLENIGPALPVPAQGCGTADTPCTFDGTGDRQHGRALAGPPAPFVVNVTAPPGAYVFHCRIHPKMAGSLTVVAAGAGGHDDRGVGRRGSGAQAADDVAAGMAAETAASKAGQVKNANGTTHLEADGGHVRSGGSRRRARHAPAQGHDQEGRHGRVATTRPQRAAHGDLPEGPQYRRHPAVRRPGWQGHACHTDGDPARRARSISAATDAPPTRSSSPAATASRPSRRRRPSPIRGSWRTDR